MKSPRPLFVTGTARSGSTLISQMLSANGGAMVAADPYLHLYRSLRNAIIRRHGSADVQKAFNPDSPLQDYYFTDERIQIMDTIQAADLDITFEIEEIEKLHERTRYRAEAECADLVPHLPGLTGRTYKEIFDAGNEIIARVRNAADRKWIGTKEVWTIEFFQALARTYPEARFIVILRDPRAVAASNLAAITNPASVDDINPLEVGHMLSYARHWRKYVAFLLHYRNHSLLRDRLYTVRYEDLVANPEEKARELCEFLEIDFDPDMLDTNKYYHFTTGSTWRGNSSFQKLVTGISRANSERWRMNLDSSVLKMIEFVCRPEMELAGYAPSTSIADRRLDPAVLSYIIQSDGEYSNWRSDLKDIQKDYGFELFRHAMLSLPEPPSDDMLIRRCFLFDEVYEAIRKNPASL